MGCCVLRLIAFIINTFNDTNARGAVAHQVLNLVLWVSAVFEPREVEELAPVEDVRPEAVLQRLLDAAVCVKQGRVCLRDGRIIMITG